MYRMTSATIIIMFTKKLFHNQIALRSKDQDKSKEIDLPLQSEIL